MKTYLFRKTRTKEILTYDEVKEMYAKSIGPDVIVSDCEMCLVMPRFMYGKDAIIEAIANELLDWCNEYADCYDNANILNEHERDNFIKKYYVGIIEGSRVGGNKSVIVGIMETLTSSTNVLNNSKTNKLRRWLVTIRNNQSW